MRRAAVVSIGAVLALVAAGPAGAGSVRVVKLQDFDIRPATVRIARGDTVEWRFLDRDALDDVTSKEAVEAGALSGSVLSLARLLNREEQTHVSVLRKTIRRLGGRPVKGLKFDFKGTTTDHSTRPPSRSSSSGRRSRASSASGRAAPSTAPRR
jgi:plastocyanin